MDITVSITDFRSLSQSELIMRNLFASVQIGGSSHPSRGVLVQEAKFRSGTVENPLVLTLKNSQTETVMYVRNIPISMVLERNGLFEHWVAVYPPGDPQNLHFDAGVVPKEGCPQVCISVAIQEDLTSTAAPGSMMQRNSVGFAYSPQERFSVDPSAKERFSIDPMSKERPSMDPMSKVDSLRNSVDSMQSELARERESLAAKRNQYQQYGGGSERGSYLHGRPSTASRSFEERGSIGGGGVDSTVREKEMQAQRIKEHVAEMANAQKRAQDATRVLQDNLRILEDMKRQLKGLEAQLIEQRLATERLERDRDQLRQEEAQLEEQIRLRDVTFQELRESRDEIDRELTRVLSEGESQKSAMEASSRDFSRQTQTMMEDIDQSKRQVTQLADSLKAKEREVAETERQARERELQRVEREAADRDGLRMQLDQTRMAMASARTMLEDTQRRSQSAEMDYQEVQARLAGIESEVQHLTGAVEGKGTESSRYGSLASDAKADLDSKKDKLAAQAKKVERLENELVGNREQLEKLSNRIAELHTEAHDKELAAKRCEDERAELQRKLELHHKSSTEASGQKSERQSQVESAERELAAARAELEALERAANEAGGGGDDETNALEGDLENKRNMLDETRGQVETLRHKCDEIESEAGKRRQQLQGKSSELEEAQNRVADLARQLAEASSDAASHEEALSRLEADLLSRTSGLEDLRKMAQMRREAMFTIQEEVATEGSATGSKIAELDQTVSDTRSQLEKLANNRRQADMQRMSLEGSLAENKLSLEQLRERIESARAARSQTESEVGQIKEKHEAALADLRRGAAELKSLQDASSAGRADLETTQGAVASKISAIEAMEAECREAAARLEAEAAELASERETKQRARESLLGEVEALRTERDEAASVVATSKKAREDLDEELNRVLRARVGLLKDGQDALSRTEAQVQEAAARSQARAERNRELNDNAAAAEARRVAASERLEALREEIRAEEARLESTQSVLGRKETDLEALRAELDGQQADVERLQVESAELEAQAREFESRCRSQEEAASELQGLLRKQKQLADDCAAEEQLHREAIERRQRELEESRDRLQRIGSEALQRKDEEIRAQEDQIRTLESERDNLLQQVSVADRERRELEEKLSERERVRAGVSSSAQEKAQACNELEMTLNATRSGAAQLEQQHAEWEIIIASISQREQGLRQEAEEMSEEIRKARQELERANEAADREVAEVNMQIDKLRDTCVAQRAEAERYERNCAEVKKELEVALNGCTEMDSEEAKLRAGLEQTKAKLADVRSVEIEQRATAEEQAVRIGRLQAEVEQTGRASTSAAAMRQTVQEFEDSLQQLSNRLIEAQEAVRRRRAEEEELRHDIQRLRESIRSTNDKMAYQMEHSNLQFETIQKLEENKGRLDGEVEVLTLGLHDAEQRNEFLQKENSLMQQQVEGLYEGSLQDWAAEVHRVKVAAEVARYKEDIDVYKQKAEQMRKEKQQELAGLQRQHEDTMRRLRERTAAVQAEIDQCEQAAQRREAALAKQREGDASADAPSAAMPGLVVPQRPLPSGHQRRKALLIGANYSTSHAPLKGCVNDLWNMQCLLRHTLQYGNDQLRLLIDCVDGRPQKPERIPTKANINSGLQWLVSGAQPGDNLLLVFCGYGAQHPRAPQSDQYEGYLVPVDFAADLPADFFDVAAGRPKAIDTAQAQAMSGGQGYRLVSMLEVAEYISQLPPMCRTSVVMDCCYGFIPGMGQGKMSQATFPKVKRGQVDYSKLRDFISRPRFLELPVLPVRHTPAHLEQPPAMKCWLHCFAGAKLEEWSAEFPIEGTVQGAFSWAFLKVLARGHFHCGLYQFQRMLIEMLSDLKVHFRGVEQSPVLQLSQSASMQDVVLWT